MSQTITLIPGDGIGPEVTEATRRVLDAAGAGFDYDVQVAGTDAVAREGDPLPQRVLESIRRNGIALKGPVTTPVGRGFKSVNVRLRQELTLYANLRPVRTLAGVPARFEGVDLIVVRENTEGLYSGLEHEVVPGVVESLKVVSEPASLRIARYAIERAKKSGRRRVTAVHKANIMKKSDGLFLDCFNRVAEDYPDIEADDAIIDALCMKLVLHPERYDMLVLENLYGDIVSDLAAGLVGGLGVVAGANVGDEAAVFEAVHGSAPDIAGQNRANPLALMRSAILMLEHMDKNDVADRIRHALRFTVVQQKILTADLGGDASTSGFADAVVKALEMDVRVELPHTD